jgi:hypothetical protein
MCAKTKTKNYYWYKNSVTIGPLQLAYTLHNNIWTASLCLQVPQFSMLSNHLFFSTIFNQLQRVYIAEELLLICVWSKYCGSTLIYIKLSTLSKWMCQQLCTEKANFTQWLLITSTFVGEIFFQHAQFLI